MCRDPNTSTYLPLLLSVIIVGLVGRQKNIKKKTMVLESRQTQVQKTYALVCVLVITSDLANFSE